MRTILILLTLLLCVSAASASPSCMTKNEARQQYRTSFLYWHGAWHCWDNRGGHRKASHARSTEIAVAEHVPLPQARPEMPEAKMEVVTEPAPTLPVQKIAIDWRERW